MMKWKTALLSSAMLLLAGAAPGQAACSNSSLSGLYGFSASGWIVGVYDPAGTFHPLSALQPLTNVGQYTFDGQGTFTHTDFPVNNGVPGVTPTTPLSDTGFRTGHTGTYNIGEDCTGTFSLSANGATIDFAAVVYNAGLTVRLNVKDEHVPGFSPALLPSGTSCSSGCDIGVNLVVELTKDVLPRR